MPQPNYTYSAAAQGFRNLFENNCRSGMESGEAMRAAVKADPAGHRAYVTEVTSAQCSSPESLASRERAASPVYSAAAQGFRNRFESNLRAGQARDEAMRSAVLADDRETGGAGHAAYITEFTDAFATVVGLAR